MATKALNEPKMQPMTDHEVIDFVNTFGEDIIDLSVMDVRQPPEVKRREKQLVLAVAATHYQDRAAVELTFSTNADAKLFRENFGHFCKAADYPNPTSPFRVTQPQAELCRNLRRAHVIYLIRQPEAKL